MAKTKHQKLAEKMSLMLKNIDIHLTKVSKVMQFVQMHFYEQCLIAGRPLLKMEARKMMFQAHFIGLQYFSPDPCLRELCSTLPWLGAIIDRPFYNDIYNANKEGIYVVPWGVRIVRPEENDENLKQGTLRALLYCPASFEISEEIDWFEKEDGAVTFTNQFLTASFYLHEQGLLRQNLLQDPFSLWQSAKEKWRAFPTEDFDPDIVDLVPLQPRNVDEADFAPQQGQSLALAYERVMKSIRERNYRHRQSLRAIYKNNLERAMFQNLSWNKLKQNAFLEEWKQNFFGEISHCNRSHERWEQCMSIDRYTAANFIKYLIQKFLKNPKSKKLGEAVCILWILLWAAQEGKTNSIHIKQVINITSQDIILDDPAIKIGGIELDISWGLHDLLLILRGKGQGIRQRRLFENIDSMGKALERLLHDASKKLLGQDVLPVLPAAFLELPHPFPGLRVPIAQRRAKKSALNEAALRYPHKVIKSHLLKGFKARH